MLGVLVLGLAIAPFGRPATAAAATTPATSRASKALESLAWMSGCWGGTVDGVEMIECWTTPAGGMLVGMHKDVFSSGKSFFEFLRVSASGDTVIYWGSPKGIPPTPFHLIEQSATRVVFANPAHDFPQRILYWSDGPDALHARVEGPSNGRDRNEEWTWHRVSDSAPRPIEETNSRSMEDPR